MINHIQYNLTLINLKVLHDLPHVFDRHDEDAEQSCSWNYKSSYCRHHLTHHHNHKSDHNINFTRQNNHQNNCMVKIITIIKIIAMIRIIININFFEGLATITWRCRASGGDSILQNICQSQYHSISYPANSFIFICIPFLCYLYLISFLSYLNFPYFLGGWVITLTGW